LELLYFIDRSLTEILQYFARLINNRLGITPWFLSVIIFFVIALDLPFILRVPDAGLVIIPLLVLFIYGRQFLEPMIAEMLLIIQLFLDPDLRDRERSYEPNHLAWASIFIATSYILLGYRLQMENVSLAFLLDGSMSFSHGIWHFFVRKKNEINKKEQDVTENLKKLLERCRSWLHLPRPVTG